jgi:hypothetical protein
MRPLAGCDFAIRALLTLRFLDCLCLLGPLDALQDERARLVRVAPANDLNLLIGFEILIVREEMLDLLDRDRR